MPARTLEKSSWQGYFDRLSKYLPAENVDIEVAALDLGAQIGAEHAPLGGVTYDANDDDLELRIGEGVIHRIAHPKIVRLEETIRGLVAFAVVDAEGREHIVKLTRALTLPER
jgi:hypothetical protein